MLNTIPLTHVIVTLVAAIALMVGSARVLRIGGLLSWLLGIGCLAALHVAGFRAAGWALIILLALTVLFVLARLLDGDVH